MNRRSFLKSLLVVPVVAKAVVANPPAPKLIGVDLASKPDSAGFCIISTNPTGPDTFYRLWIQAMHDDVWQSMGIPAEYFSK